MYVLYFLLKMCTLEHLRVLLFHCPYHLYYVSF